MTEEKNTSTPITKKVTKKKRNKSADYVNNADFSQAVADHVRGVKQDITEEKEARMISDYIAVCFLKICNGLSHRPNFINYTYREDMVMDAVENCIKAIRNYDIDKPTRTGKSNAFSYFTQISYFAFLRRIEKEKKQTAIKQKIIDTASVDVFADYGEGEMAQIGESVITRMRSRNPFYKDHLGPTAEEAALPPKRPGRKRKAKKLADSNLTSFWDDKHKYSKKKN